MSGTTKMDAPKPEEFEENAHVIDGELEEDLFEENKTMATNEQELASSSDDGSAPIPATIRSSTSPSPKASDPPADPKAALALKKREQLERRQAALEKAAWRDRPDDAANGTSPSKLGGLLKRKRDGDLSAVDVKKTKPVSSKKAKHEGSADATETKKPVLALPKTAMQQPMGSNGRPMLKPTARLAAAKIAGDPEIRRMSNAHTPADSQKRKRSADNEDDDEPKVKRGLTDAVATEIAQNREHTFSDDLEKGKGSKGDSTTGAGKERSAVDTVEKKAEGSTPVGKTVVPIALPILEDDDELTRSLKYELAKPYIDPYEEDEDPRVEEAMKPLTEAEKRILAAQLAKRTNATHELPTLKTLKKGVDIVLKNRAEKAEKAAKAAEAKAAAMEKERAAREEAQRKKQMQEIRAAEGAMKKKYAPKKPSVAAPVPATTAAAALTPPRASPGQTQTIFTGPTAAPPEYSAFNLEKLKQICRERGILVGGTKTKLVVRLQEYDYHRSLGEASPSGVKKGASPKGTGKFVIKR